MLDGFDISHWQNDRGDIQWDQLCKNKDFDFIKITDGDNYVDPSAKENVTNSKKQGLITGGYHYARFNTVKEAEKEAEHFISIAKDYGLNFVVLDIEDKSQNGDLTSAALVFLDKVSEIAPALLYSYPAFIKEHFNSRITRYPLWIANYGVKKPSFSLWKDWKVWQYSSSASIDGINGNVDVDYMDDDFAKQANVSANKSKPKSKTKHKKSKVKPMKTKKYKIKSGDNFWKLEEKWHLRHGLLQKLNGNVNPKKLQIGQKINIPASVHKEIKHVKRNTKVYKVKSGNTLSGIASKFNTSVKHIMSLNSQIKDPDKIYVGEKIKLVKNSNNDKRRYHEVVSGDTLSEIAKANNTTVRRLMQLNPNIDNKDKIYVGQKIRVA